ncbi:MAG TPA: hypothetical protein VGV64_07765 [Thermoplasmata archaeon]|nr:hypothetical protein [Thermoplasmata archaeon]HEV2429719.1 hypothetical protein [Thermoplasmata archaeon]
MDRSKEQISKLLREYGAEGISWSENFQSGELQLRFVVSRGEGSPPTMYRITPAAFKEKHSTYDPVKGRHVTVEAPNWPRAMRLLHAWLKTKLESIAYGLTEVEEEFLAQRVIRDSAGNEATVGELVLPAIEEGGGRLSLEAPKRRDGAIDASFRGPA